MSKQCMECGQNFSENLFYKRKDNSFLPICKNCTVKGINPYEPSTAAPALWFLNIPFFNEQWSNIIGYCYSNGIDITAREVFGRYLSKMKLNGFKNYEYEDYPAPD